MHPPRTRALRAVTTALAVLLLLAGDLVAQQDPKPPGLNAEAITAALTAVKDAADLSDSDRTAAVESYTKALEAVQLGDKSTKTGRDFLAAKEKGPPRLLAVRAALEQPAATTTPEPPEGGSLADLEVLATAAENAARTADKELADATARIRTRAERHPQLPRLIAAAREQLATTKSQLDAAEKAGGTAPPEVARRTELLALVYAHTQEVFALESELARRDGAEELLTAERDLAKRQSDEANALAQAWRELVQARRAADAQAAEQNAPPRP